jgi:hypothetical protein
MEKKSPRSRDPWRVTPWKSKRSTDSMGRGKNLARTCRQPVLWPRLHLHVVDGSAWLTASELPALIGGRIPTASSAAAAALSPLVVNVHGPPPVGGSRLPATRSAAAVRSSGALRLSGVARRCGPVVWGGESCVPVWLTGAHEEIRSNTRTSQR